MTTMGHHINIMKLLVILFLIKVYARKNIFKCYKKLHGEGSGHRNTSIFNVKSLWLSTTKPERTEGQKRRVCLLKVLFSTGEKFMIQLKFISTNVKHERTSRTKLKEKIIKIHHSIEIWIATLPIFLSSMSEVEVE